MDTSPILWNDIVFRTGQSASIKKKMIMSSSQAALKEKLKPGESMLAAASGQME